MRVFLDTSYYIALLYPHDQWHRRAVKALRNEDEAFTSSLVINETISLMQTRGYFSLITNEDVAEAWDQFARWGSSGANAVDCATFAAMRRLGIKKALTFDAHFRDAGFDTL